MMIDFGLGPMSPRLAGYWSLIRLGKNDVMPSSLSEHQVSAYGRAVFKTAVRSTKDGSASVKTDFSRMNRSTSHFELKCVTHPQGVPEYTLTVNASITSSDAGWPDYPTGALDPKDVQGGELYGRSAFIKKIVSSFGQSRTQATYLIEGGGEADGQDIPSKNSSGRMP